MIHDIVIQAHGIIPFLTRSNTLLPKKCQWRAYIKLIYALLLLQRQMETSFVPQGITAAKTSYYDLQPNVVKLRCELWDWDVSNAMTLTLRYT